MTATAVTLEPAIIYPLAAIGATSGAVLFFILRSRLKALERRVLEAQEAAEADVGALRQAFSKLAEDADDLMEAARIPAGTAPVRNGLNLSRRSQALRMHRRGEMPHQIAATLGVTSQEIELLLKVHQILITNV
jgi:hypothetical protein